MINIAEPTTKVQYDVTRDSMCVIVYFKNENGKEISRHGFYIPMLTAEGQNDNFDWPTVAASYNEKQVDELNRSFCRYISSAIEEVVG
jgi:hypothetical protein